MNRAEKILRDKFEKYDVCYGDTYIDDQENAWTAVLEAMYEYAEENKSRILTKEERRMRYDLCSNCRNLQRMDNGVNACFITCEFIDDPDNHSCDRHVLDKRYLPIDKKQ